MMYRRVQVLIILLVGTYQVMMGADTSSVQQADIGLSVFRGVKLSFISQIWTRYTAANPGTTVFGDEQKDIWDVGLRRTRIVMSGNIDPKTYVFVQAGMNNFNYISPRKQGFFFHDVVAHRKLAEQFNIGGGLTAWGGFSRFSSPSVGSIMGVDAPLVAQATNDASDQFVRRLSLFAKGEINKLHYRFALSKPLAIEQSSQNTALTYNSSFRSSSSPQVHGYVKYDIADKEKHDNPYFKGTYLGSKNVFSVGVGALYQKDAMHHLNTNDVESKTDLLLLSADVFIDVKLDNDNAINFYYAYYYYDFGKDYIRNVGAMNPANGNNNASILNGGGSAFPMIGSGNSVYFQTGYLFKNKLGERTQLMPYLASQLSEFERLNQAMLYVDAGVSILLNAHSSKLTLAYQNRPIYEYDSNGKGELTERKGLVVLQYQWSI